MNYIFENGNKTTSIGRNGILTTTGIEVLQTNDPQYGKVAISPITSRGTVGNCMITIPNRKEDIRSLIEMLRIAHEHATD